jgi:hypothetical protein
MEEYIMVPNVIKKIPGYSYFRDVLKYAISRTKTDKLNETVISLPFPFTKRVTLSEKYPDKTFYIIRNRPKNMANLGAYFYSVLNHIMYADACGYIPVVDMENYLTAYNERKPIHGTWNAWEYYFKQPSPYTLEEAYSAKNVILSPLDKESIFFPYSLSFVIESSVAIRSNYIKKYISFASQVVEATEEKGILFNGKRNILGVMIPGSGSYRKLMFHPITPDSTMFLQKTIEAYKEWNMEYVFLSTIDEYAIDSFKDAFNDKLLLLARARIKPQSVPEENGLPSDHKNHPIQQSPYTAGLEYLIDMIMLSKCDSYIGPLSFGSNLVIDLNNNQYRNRFIFDLGLNPPDNNILVGYHNCFVPYPPSFDEVINKIIPAVFPAEFTDYLRLLSLELKIWIDTHEAQ